MSKHLLVVDDEYDVVEVIKRRLEAKGYTVGVASNGIEGLYYVKRHSVDLIILDIMMPEMDGTEMAERLKDDPHTAHIPIIFLSAILEKKETFGGGTSPNIVLAKPFDSDELMEKVRLLLLENKKVRI